MAVRAVLGAGLVLLLAAIGFTLGQTAPRAAGSNHVPEVEEAEKLGRAGGRHCQTGETIPGDAAALRLLVGTHGRPAPELRVNARRPGGEVVTAGELPGGGPEGRLEVPVDEVDDTVAGVRVCVRVGPGGRTVLYGAGGRVRLEWMRAGSESWFELLPTIAHRFGLGRASLIGSALLPLMGLLLLAAWAAAIRLVLREARVTFRERLARIPSAAWWCAAVAFVNVAVWATVVPPFQVPDETSHVAYVQHLAETGEAPNEPEAGVFSDEEARLLETIQFNSTVGHPTEGTIWSELQDRAIDQVEDAPLKADNAGGIQSNSNQPPLYYLLGSGVYWLSPSDGLLDRVMLLRLLSAALAALTTLFAFLFLREVFVERWTWTIGSLAVAFQPTFGFISGGVTPDALMFTASAALFFTLARVFRRGLTLERGLAIGAVLSVGALAKLNFLALIPGALAGLIVVAWRARDRVRALPAVGAAAGLLAVAALAYVAVNLGLWDRSAWGGGLATAGTNVTGGGDGVAAIGLTERLGYTWQLYLPRPPFMADQFAYFPPYTTWFKGGIGLFGWLDTPFPNWTYTLALVIAVPLALLAAVALVQRRNVLLERWPELVTYALMVAGLLVSIGFSGVRYRKDSGFIFEQARYLLPLLPLYASFVALATLGAGRWLGRPLGAAIVVLALGHGVFAQLLVIGRYYA